MEGKVCCLEIFARVDGGELLREMCHAASKWDLLYSDILAMFVVIIVELMLEMLVVFEIV